MPFNQNAQDALVYWANTFHTDKKAESPEDFYDGVILSQVLSDLDSSYDPSEIQTTDDNRWLTQKKNLQSVYKGLVRLINRDCPGLGNQAKIADFRAIASEPDAQGISKVGRSPYHLPYFLRPMYRSKLIVDYVMKILSLMFAVAMLGTNNERFIMRITQDVTDKTVLLRLQEITMEMKAEIDEAEKTAGEEGSREADTRDPDLALEEENAELHSQLEKKKKNLADMETRLAHLQESYDALKEQTSRQAMELEDFQNVQSGGSDQVIRSLEMKIREQDELIASQEGQAEDDRIARSRLNAEMQNLKAKATKGEEYEDEVKELRYKVEELERKANMVERYKQKLEAQASLQKERDNLLYEKEQMQRDLLDYEKLLKRNRVLEDTEKQYAKRMQDYEMEFVEMETKRKTFQSEMLHLKELVKTHEAQRMADERFITELQEQINLGGTDQGAISSPDATASAFNLEEELENAKDVAPNLTLEISRLKAENNLLRSGMGSGTENARLRQDLEDEKNQRRRIQDDYNTVFEKWKVAESDANALMQDVPGQRLVEFFDTRYPNGYDGTLLTRDYTSNEILTNFKSQLEKTLNEQKEEAKTVRELREQIADKDRELLSAKTDLSAVEKGGAEALEELKATDQLISGSLRDDLEALRIEYKNITTDSDENQKALVKALLEKDTLRKELDMLKDQSPSSAQPNDPKANEKIKQLRQRLQERNEQYEAAEREKLDLKRKLKASQDGSAVLEQKAQSDQIIKNLQRENALITTAWYDLTSRLQSNHVVLQRRNDMPKSWLNKQRQMVNGTHKPWSTGH